MGDEQKVKIGAVLQGAAHELAVFNREAIIRKGNSPSLFQLTKLGKTGAVRVLADGGQETNILKPTRGASYQLTGPLSSDLDSDGYVNSDDLAILFSNWGAPEEPKADINKDGKVDIADLSILFANF